MRGHLHHVKEERLAPSHDRSPSSERIEIRTCSGSGVSDRYRDLRYHVDSKKNVHVYHMDVDVSRAAVDDKNKHASANMIAST